MNGARLDRLENLLGDPVADLAEKYRRVQEAYRIELDYARSAEAYRAVLRTGNEERPVDFPGVGHLALYYRTLNGHVSGIWRNDQRRWQRLSGEENESIARGLRAARKLEPPRLTVLPRPGPRSPCSRGAFSASSAARPFGRCLGLFLGPSWPRPRRKPNGRPRRRKRRSG